MHGMTLADGIFHATKEVPDPASEPQVATVANALAYAVAVHSHYVRLPGLRS